MFEPHNSPSQYIWVIPRGYQSTSQAPCSSLDSWRRSVRTAILSLVRETGCPILVLYYVLIKMAVDGY
jgi:hypothetical protein